MGENRGTGTYEYAHGGDIYRNRVKIDFSVNLNPLGMPVEVKDALRGAVDSWSVYPDPLCSALRERLAECLDVKEASIVFGNGVAELIYNLVFALRPKKALICVPTFSEYEAALRKVNCDISFFPLSEENGFKLNVSDLAAAVKEDTDIVFLCNPNNPTGECLLKDQVREIEKACREKQALLCVDESFVELTADPDKYSVVSDCRLNKGLCVLRAFTKTYALAGLRLGYLICYDEKLISLIMGCRQPWSVSSPAQTAGLAVLERVPSEYLENARILIEEERKRMSRELKRRDFSVIDGAADFILFYSSFDDLYERCLGEGILIRDCGNFTGLKSGYFRIGLRTAQENSEFLKALDLCF